MTPRCWSSTLSTASGHGGVDRLGWSQPIGVYFPLGAEAVNNLYKTELIRQRGPWRTVEQVELATLEWVWWWNHQRLHGELGMRTPIEIEDAYYADLESGLPATAGQGNR